jgi:PAS domain S-box-containing protein
MDTEQTRPQIFEAPYEDLFEANPHPMWVYDLETLCFLAVNDAAIAQYGYSREEFLRMRILDLHPAEIHDRVIDSIRNVPGPYRRVSFGRHLKKDGSFRHVEITTHDVRFTGREARLTLIRDVTDRQRAEELAEIRLRQQAVIAGLGQEALAGADLAALMSRAAGEIAGVLDVPLCEVLELLPDKSALLLRAGVGWREGQIGCALIDRGPSSQAGYTLQTRDPVIVSDAAAETRFSGPPLLREHAVVSGVSVVIGDPERPYGVLGAHSTVPRAFTVHDVHFLKGVAIVLGSAIQRSESEAALRESEERFRSLFENSIDAILLTVPDGRILAANPAACRMFGRSEADIRRIGRAGIVDESDPRLRVLIEQRERTGRTEGDLTFIRRDGTRFPGFVSSGVFRDLHGQVRSSLTVQDLTDVKKAEARVADQIAELRRWHDATLGRERRILELKQEVNELLAASGQPPRYLSVVDGSADDRLVG